MKHCYGWLRTAEIKTPWYVYTKIYHAYQRKILHLTNVSQAIVDNAVVMSFVKQTPTIHILTLVCRRTFLST